MEDPRATSPRSIMPSYPWLLTRELDLSDLSARLRTLRRLGVPYTEQEIASAEGFARVQAEAIAAEIAEQGGPERLESREIVALVAYLQSLKAPEAPPVATATPPTP
jgi:cytochrome c oxidase cbb3-type subunit I/II